MSKFLFFAFILLSPLVLRAQVPHPVPSKVSTTEDFRLLLQGTKWLWKNVVAKVPDRECTFMPDGTFHHANFNAKYTIKDINVVELRRKGGVMALTFDPTYTSFEAMDFEHHRITGTRE